MSAPGSPAYHRPSCHPPDQGQPIDAAPVPGVASDFDVTSFDGTVIRAHWFPVSLPAPAPTVLMGPGWGETGDTSPSAPQLFGGLSIDQLHAAGFNVLTWDPRGIGDSTGTVELDSPSYEARDVETLISWLATLPGVKLDGPDDPAVGMVGGSYGGGIQFTAAAVDCRIDAIVPTIAWHSLATSIYKAQTIKSGWLGILVDSANVTGMRLDPRLVASENDLSTGVIEPDQLAIFLDAGPGSLVSKISAPTLIVQGTVDNLFTLDEGVANYEALKARGTPVEMLWFCGGHGVCLTPPGNQQVITQATVAWLDKYVKHDGSAQTGPGFRFVDQNGNAYQAASYPLPLGAPLRASGSGSLDLVATGGSGPAPIPPTDHDPLAAIAGSTVPGRARNAVDVDVSSGSRNVLVIGPPRLTITYTGTVPPGQAPTRVFAQVVDDKTGMVLGNQVTPIDVTLDGRRHTETVPLEIVVAALQARSHLTLQLVATTVAYETPRLGGTVNFDNVEVSLPVSNTIAPR